MGKLYKASLILAISMFGSMSCAFSQAILMNKTGVTNDVSCSGTFYDSGGSAANYTANETGTKTICPPTPGNYVSMTFTQFAIAASGLLSSGDILYVYSGATSNAPCKAVMLSTTVAPVTFTSSANDGCLTFRFVSPNGSPKAGWTATFNCEPTKSPTFASPQNQDCASKKKICTKQTFSENNNGSGPYTSDMTSANTTCVSSESNSSWYYFVPTKSGSFTFLLTPATASDDYDFSIWGPDPGCPPVIPPARCSFCATAGNTGLDENATVDSENAGGCTRFVRSMNVVAGSVYVLLINRYSGSKNGFSLSFGGTAQLDCQDVEGVVLPIELISFNYKQQANGTQLKWKTASEKNNSHFIIERNTGGDNYAEVGRVRALGNTGLVNKYEFLDYSNDQKTDQYYRLRQVDFNGESNTSVPIRVPALNLTVNKSLSIFPNPMPAFSKHLVFTYNASQECNARVSIINPLGETVFESTQNLVDGNNQIELNLSSELTHGVYILSIETPDEKSVQKLQVN